MSKRKKTFEMNFATLLFFGIIIGLMIYAYGRASVTKSQEQNQNQEVLEETQQTQNTENVISKIYSNDVIILDIGYLSSNWEVVEKANDSIIYYIQGPSKENDDGTTDDIRINVYVQESSMTNEELKTQLLEHSIYSNIEYTKVQLINDVQWREFEAENKGIKAKILAVMKDGYMYAIEITGEENIYSQYYNEAMKTAMSVRIAERIPSSTASTTIYNYGNLANIKIGGTKYLLSSLSLSKTIEDTGETLPEKYSDYIFTGIKYSDFEEAMLKYMTKDVLKSEFSEFIDYNGTLYIKETTGNQSSYMIESTKVKSIKGTETTYEVVKQNMDNYITLIQYFTLKYEDGECVVSNVEA